MRHLLLIISAMLLCGCGPTIGEQIDHQLGLTFDAGKSLLVSIDAYRLGSGGLAVKFDRWVAPGGSPMMSNVSIELPAPTAAAH